MNYFDTIDPFVLFPEPKLELKIPCLVVLYNDKLLNEYIIKHYPAPINRHKHILEYIRYKRIEQQKQLKLIRNKYIIIHILQLISDKVFFYRLQCCRLDWHKSKVIVNKYKQIVSVLNDIIMNKSTDYDKKIEYFTELVNMIEKYSPSVYRERVLSF